MPERKRKADFAVERPLRLPISNPHRQAMRVALHDAAPLYRDAPEAQAARASGDRIIELFMREALPSALEATRALAGDLIGTTLGTVGKQFSEVPRSSAEIEAYADAMADMFCAYLERLG